MQIIANNGFSIIIKLNSLKTVKKIAAFTVVAKKAVTIVGAP